MKNIKLNQKAWLFRLAGLFFAAGMAAAPFSAAVGQGGYWHYPPLPPLPPLPPPPIHHTHLHEHAGEHAHFHPEGGACDVHNHGHVHDPYHNSPYAPPICGGYTGHSSCGYGYSDVCRARSGRFCRQFALNHQPPQFSACISLPPSIFFCAQTPPPGPVFSSSCAPVGAPCSCVFYEHGHYGYGEYYELGMIQ